jgi:hypothetical protein
MFALPSRCRGDDAAADEKSADWSTKYCHSNDEETGDSAVQRLKMLSSTTEASVAPTVIYGAWCTQRTKKE